MTDIKPPRFPVGTVVFSRVFHDPDTTKTVYAAKWDGAEYRYTLQDAFGTKDYGYFDKDLIAQDVDLIDKLRDEDSYYRLQEKHWCIDAEELERQRLAAANCIEALVAEIDRLRGALSWAEDADPVLVDAIRNRAALGEK